MTRISNFLAGRPRLVWKFPSQEPQEVIDIYVDANWAGCRRTRKSTSGGCAMLGKHCIKAWPKAQLIVAKSSGESEVYCIIKGSSEGLGLVTLAGDLGRELKTRVHADATAAMGMVERRGISRVRHIEVDHLWIQEQEARRMLPISKVDGGHNPADLMTKNVGIALVMKHMTAKGIRFADGRSEAAVKIHHVEGKDKWKVELSGTHLNVMKKHEVPRTKLYLPGGEEGYPVHSYDFEAMRITTGVTASGKIFEIEDNWRRPGRGSGTRRIMDGKYDFRRQSLRTEHGQGGLDRCAGNTWSPYHASAGRRFQGPDGVQPTGIRRV